MKILALLVVLPFLGGICSFALSRKSSEWARAFGVFILAVNLFLALFAWLAQTDRFDSKWMLELDVPWIPAIGASFHLGMDGFSFVLVLLANAISLFAVVNVSDVSRRREGLFFLLLLTTVSGVLGILLSVDLLLFFLFWEVMLVPLYFLILLFGEDQRQKAATQFLILTQASGLFLFLSIVSLYFFNYSETGLTTFSYETLLNLNHSLSLNTEMWLMAGFLLAFLVKLPSVPFHFWMPSIFANAPVSALMSGILIKTGAYGLMRFAIPLFPNATAAIAPYFMILGIASMIYGGIVAFSQHDIKKILAYSTISHVGLILAGIFSQNPLAMTGVIVLLITQAISTGALLMLCNHVSASTKSHDISRFSGLYASMPMAGVVAMIFTMAAIGLPGLGNFVGEWLVLLGIFQVSPYLGAFACLGIVLSALYMLRFMHAIFFGESHETQGARDLSSKSLFLYSILICVLAGIGLFPYPLLDVVSFPWRNDGGSEMANPDEEDEDSVSLPESRLQQRFSTSLGLLS